MPEQRISVVTVGSADLDRSRRFYSDGFGWKTAFEADDILFYQLNGIILGLYKNVSFADDMGIDVVSGYGGFALAHNVREEGELEPLMNRLVAAGGSILRKADPPPHGGLRGYVRDPDGHAWEIAHNPGFPIDADGNVTFTEEI